MAGKDPIESARKALLQVKSAIKQLSADLQALQVQRNELDQALRQRLTAPLSKAALVAFGHEMIDEQAAAYAELFANTAGPAMLKVDRYGSSSSLLTLADTEALQGRMPAHFGEQGPPSQNTMHGIKQFVPHVGSVQCLSFFFGEMVKAKIEQLWGGVTLPYADDGKSLAERREEIAQLQRKIAHVDKQIAAVNERLTEMRAVDSEETRAVDEEPVQ
ncbi:hypothetical protein EBQ24_02910 [Allofranklinella schreckenbergeri]|uniref:Uncharacterized protein n=1 Tax=Allofranklinella schreckenbergeri TaxID=1076744 RepID=A0A3M6R654_9BURK|nr:hypothetical protein [Allofranklinella schreckenbergeri]RMX10862.1 hypothetical protein EBQ24_02910 [Allofranklinella schreckenbergeri]